MGPNFAAEVSAFTKKRIEARVGDLRFVLKKIMTSSDDPILNAVNTDQIGVFGHSLGGIAAAETSKWEPSIKSVINYDGLLITNKPFYYPDQAQNIKAQFLLMTKKVKPLDAAALAKFNKPASFNEERERHILSAMDSALSSISNNSYRLVLKQASHQSFSDEPFFTSQPSQLQFTLLASIREFTLDFFRNTLTDQSGFDNQKQLKSDLFELKYYK